MPSYYFPSIQCSAIAKELLQILLVIIPGSQGQHVWVRYGLKDCESQLKNVVGFHARFHQQLKNVNSVSSQGIFPLYLKSKLNKAGLDHFLNCWIILSNKCSQRSVKDFVEEGEITQEQRYSGLRLKLGAFAHKLNYEAAALTTQPPRLDFLLISPVLGNS